MTLNPEQHQVCRRVCEALHALAARGRTGHDVDPEADHGRADDLLLEVLEALGAQEVADAYRQADKDVGFWYA